MSEMTAAISPSFNANVKQSKPPSFPSESPHHRPKSRDVASRYLGGGGASSFSSSSFFHQSSPSSVKRCQSPTVTRPVTPSVTINRPKSTPRRESLDRRGSGGEVSSAQSMLLSSGRSLFASFQADSFTGNEYRSKQKSSPTTPGRGTVEKKKTISTATASRSSGAQQEKSKLSEQWPRSLQPNCLSRSVDFTDTRKKLIESGNGVARALQNSIVNNRPVSRITRDSLSVDLEVESVSSGSSNGRGKMLPAHGSMVKARVSQLTSNRSQHRLEPGSQVAKSKGLRKISVDSHVLSPKGSKLFPKSEQIRPASPSKFGMTATLSSPRRISIARGISPSRGVVPPRGISPSGRMSPVRVRSSLTKNTPLVLNFAVDVKEKVRDNGVADAHLLKLLHNRLLQWRLANARANAVISAQKIKAERRLYNAWISISKPYDSVRGKRIELQHLKHNLKLISILNRQMGYLEECLVMDRDHMGSLVGAAEALKGSTLCLPVDCGAMVNVQSVKDAICSAVDVMQAMASSICLLLPKVGKISSLAAELGSVNIKEEVMLDVCRELLNKISARQVTECSLRTQVTQLLR